MEAREIRFLREYPWRCFWLLLGLALFGVGSVMPYAVARLGHKIEPELQPLSPVALLAFELLESTLLFGVIVGIGLPLANKVKLPSPILDAWCAGKKMSGTKRPLIWSTIAGVAFGFCVALFMAKVLLRLAPQWPLDAMRNVALGTRLLSCVYSGINETLLAQLFGLSLIIWLLHKILRRDPGDRGLAIFWVANFAAAILYAATLLPSARTLIAMTPVAVLIHLGTNTVGGMLFGYLAWTLGLEAAICAHFFCNATLQIFATRL